MAQSKSLKMPVVLPPYSVEGADVQPGKSDCLFYMETLGIAVFNQKDGANPKAWSAEVGSVNTTENTFAWDESYAKCLPAKQPDKADGGQKSTSQNFT
jgi:hypothetical protein